MSWLANIDRSRQPIEPTEIGEKIIRQAQVIIYQANQLKEAFKMKKIRFQVH